ncbi:MAG: AAA family ATPase [Actinomycetota bacterium]
MTGLPASGKSSIAAAIADRANLPLFSADPLEAALIRRGITRDHGSGYAAYDLLETLVDTHLGMGQSVVVDACNHLDTMRAAWSELCRLHGAELFVIECGCSDPTIHRRRFDERERGLDGFPEPSWEDVETVRDAWTSWPEPAVRIDSLDPHRANLELALVELGGRLVSGSVGR